MAFFGNKVSNQLNHISRPGQRIYRIFLWILFMAFIAWNIFYYFNTVSINNSKDEVLIESFVFQKSKNENLKEDIEGTIDHQSRVVYFQNPDSADLSELNPTIILNEKVTSYIPKGPQNFTYSVAYTFTLKNGEEIKYYIINGNPPDSFSTEKNFWRRFVKGLRYLF